MTDIVKDTLNRYIDNILNDSNATDNYMKALTFISNANMSINDRENAYYLLDNALMMYTINNITE